MVMPGLKISHSMLPLRISTKGPDNTADLTISVLNTAAEEKLVSVDVNIVTKGLVGFDKTMVHRRATKNIGNIAPGEQKSFTARVYATQQTHEGPYTVQVTAFDHYLDFNKVLEKISKTFDIRVV
jgi:O-acetyl-ADP-ribose deacetylase (regulator of RNase III)